MNLEVFLIENGVPKPGPPLDTITVPADADEDGILNELHFHHPTFDARFAGVGLPYRRDGQTFEMVLGRDDKPIYALKVVSND